jgi:hypothetical protein
MSTETIASIEAEIALQKELLASLERKLEKAKKESPNCQLAKELHGMLCTVNHTDGCSWFYEVKDGEDDWTGYSHGMYLKKAQKLIHECKQKGVTVEQALELHKLLKGI